MIFEEEKIDALLAHCRFTEALAFCALAGNRHALRAGLCAVAGAERELARFVDPPLLACRTAGEVAAHYTATSLDPTAYDYLVAGTVLAWSADAAGAYGSFRAAHDRAFATRRFHLAVAARERLAHHALLFGDVAVARDAIDDAVALAQAHRLSSWLLRSLAAAARFALDAGDLDGSALLLTRGRATAGSPEELALFAGTSAQLGVELGDDAALRAWNSPEIVDVALHCERSDAAISATIAGLIAAGASGAAPVVIALRRALLQAGGDASATELFSLAARYGDLEEACFAVDALRALVAPNRPYLRAHQLLARAHFLFRSGEREGWVDCAGDAARAFSAMGMRRWTNDAMRLLVTHEPSSERRPRGRLAGSALTGREQQVAHLIRRGARNREVAAALQISEHTVERHVSSILGRLGLRSRWQIADPKKSKES
jgi:DNA-binding CsgD family transcriptional regulator